MLGDWLAGLASCLVPGKRRPEKRKRDEEDGAAQADQHRGAAAAAAAAATRSGRGIPGGSAARPAKRTAVAQRSASPPHVLQQRPCPGTTPGSSERKRYGADPSALQDSDSEDERKLPAAQPQFRGHSTGAWQLPQQTRAARAALTKRRAVDMPASAAAQAQAAVQRHAVKQAAARRAAKQNAAPLPAKQAAFPATKCDPPLQPERSPQKSAAVLPAHPPAAFTKGQVVWYRQRDGSEVQAQVVAVDCTVDPPSFAVLLEGRSEARETVQERLRPLTPAASGSGSGAAQHVAQTAAATAAQGQQVNQGIQHQH